LGLHEHGRRRGADKESPGARELFWDGYIEPFLKKLTLSEIAATTAWARTNGVPAQRALHELRTEFLAGYIRIYWTMAEVHRQTWFKLPNGLIRRDTSEEVGHMMAFFDSSIDSALKNR
jgi:hypothetical protein